MKKKIVFENLYIGYEAEVMRFPLEEYNRDIIIFLEMFGYKYKNSKNWRKTLIKNKYKKILKNNLGKSKKNDN